MSTIVMANCKGGVGKSSVALAVWEAFASSALAVDLDSQCNFSSSVESVVKSDYSIFDVLTGKVSADQAISKASTGDYIASSVELVSLQPLALDTLKNALKSIKGNYEHIVIDTPPNCYDLTLNALTASDVVVIPVEADVYSLDGLNQMIEVINFVRSEYNPTLKLGGLLINRYTGRANVDKQVLDYAHTVAEEIGTRLFKTVIREFKAVVREAHLRKESIYSFAPRSKVVQDFKKFVDELLEVL